MNVTKLPLSRAVFIVCMLFAATAVRAESGYTFTLVADSAGMFRDFGFDSPSLNATGTVAFNAMLDNGRFGIFKGNGGPVITITTNPVPFGGYSSPSINQAGTVAFYELQGSFEVERILAGYGGPLMTIADTAGQFRGFATGYTTAINTAGTVAFWAFPDTGPAGVFASTGGTVTPLFLNTASLAANSDIAFNDAGTVAFRGTTGTAIVTVSGGSITTIVDTTGPLNYFGSAPSLNETGTVAFVAGMGGVFGSVSGIYTGNGGPLTTIADLSGPFSYLGGFNFGQPSINGDGNVAFVASLDAGGGGLFIGDGAATNEVIGSGDSLFGSMVTNLGISPTSLNDSGQVAFWYQLANGTTGIAIANPVPEPSSLLLLALSIGLSLACRPSRERRAI